MSLIGSEILAGASGQAGAAAYEIEQSLRFDGSSGYLNWTPGSAGDRTLWTWSAWIKRSGLSSTMGLFGSYAAANNTDYLEILFASGNTLLVQGNSTAFLNTSQVFRDTSAWYHIVIAVDTSNATADDRIKIYVNGEQVTAFGTRNNPSSGGDLGVNQAGVHRLGRRPNDTNYFDGYMAEVNFIDGSALDPEDFGEFDDNGVWRPIQYAGSYTGNSFYLKFASGDGTDSSGLSNTWTANGFTVNPDSYVLATKTSGTFSTGTLRDVFDTNSGNYGGVYQEATTGSEAASTIDIEFSSPLSGTITVDAADGTGGTNTGGQYQLIDSTDTVQVTQARPTNNTTFTHTGLSDITKLRMYGGSSGLGGILIGRFESSDQTIRTADWLGEGDVMSDTPTTNWCTLNPISVTANLPSGYAKRTPYNGNLGVSFGQSAGGIDATFAITPSSGKFYWEITVDIDGNNQSTTRWGVLVDGSAYDIRNAQDISSVTDGDVIGVAIDANAGEARFYLNNTLVGGDPKFTFSSGWELAVPWMGVTSNGSRPQSEYTFNFGQRAFAYTPPTGYSALNTSNLSEPEIADGSEYFAALVGPGDTETAWSETNTSVSVSGGQLTNHDGLANTEYLLGRTDTKYPPIDFIRSLRELELDGHDDWYLGSKYEMEVIYYNLKPTTDNNTTVASSQDNAYSVPQRTSANYTTSDPAQTSVTAFQSGGAQAFDSETSTAQVHYTSSAPNTNVANAKAFRTSGGLAAGYNYNSGQKYSENGITRAIRRVAYTGSEPSLGAAYEGGYYAGLYSLNGDGTATHALIVSDKANGENTGMKALVQQKFSSGLYWIKDRQASDEHKLIDSVRGLTNQLSSNLTSAETTYSDPNNASVAWNWLAGNGTSTPSGGSIASTVSANPTAGFSIVTFTGNATAGATIAHGLGVKPKWMIVRQRDNTSHWAVYTETEGAGRHLLLNSTNAAANSGAGNYFTAEPTSTVFTVGSNGNVNANGGDMLAYCFAEVEGYSKFGYISGLNNDEFVYLGFKPAWIMFKRTSTTSNWAIRDSKRDTYNITSKELEADTSSSESTFAALDFLSNGFKAQSFTGVSGGWVYFAFAEHPFGGSGVSPATAR